jgi:hypothetical protein
MVSEEEKDEKMADLEEDGLAVAADGAAHVLGAGQRGVAGDVLEHLGELAGAVVHHVPVHAVVVRDLLRRFQQSISDCQHMRGFRFQKLQRPKPKSLFHIAN